MNGTIEEPELAERIRKYGFAAVIEVASDTHKNSRSRSFPGRKIQASRSRNYVRKIARENEIIGGFCYYSSYFSGIGPHPADFVVRLSWLKKEIMEQAYERMIETCGKLRDDERAFATALYDNREKILLASLHERDSPRERFIAREATRLSGDNFVRQMGAIKGAATESYVAILLKQHLETADIISSFEYIQHEPGNAFSKQTHKFEIDLIVACPEEDFYSALSSLNKQEHIHVGISPGLHGKILKYD